MQYLRVTTLMLEGTFKLLAKIEFRITKFKQSKGKRKKMKQETVAATYNTIEKGYKLSMRKEVVSKMKF